MRPTRGLPFAAAPVVSLAPGETLPSLQEEIARLSAPEQEVLVQMLQTAREAPGASARPLDPLMLIHSRLKSGGPDDVASSEQEVSSAVAMPTVKSFPGAPVFEFPKEHGSLEISLQAALHTRFSTHNFGTDPIPFETLGTFLFHSTGMKRQIRAYNLRRFPLRTSPTAGGLQPIDLYMVVNDVSGLDQGLYYYDHTRHALVQVDRGNMRQRMLDASMYQKWVFHAPVILAMVCNFPRIFWKYRWRGYRFVHADCGVLTQNFYLVGTALRFNTCAVAGFYDDPMNELLGLDGRDEFTLLNFAIGLKPRAPGVHAAHG